MHTNQRKIADVRKICVSSWGKKSNIRTLTHRVIFRSIYKFKQFSLFIVSMLSIYLLTLSDTCFALCARSWHIITIMWNVQSLTFSSSIAFILYPIHSSHIDMVMSIWDGNMWRAYQRIHSSHRVVLYELSIVVFFFCFCERVEKEKKW